MAHIWGLASTDGHIWKSPGKVCFVHLYALKYFLMPISSMCVIWSDVVLGWMLWSFQIGRIHSWLSIDLGHLQNDWKSAIWVEALRLAVGMPLHLYVENQCVYDDSFSMIACWIATSSGWLVWASAGGSSSSSSLITLLIFSKESSTVTLLLVWGFGERVPPWTFIEHKMYGPLPSPHLVTVIFLLRWWGRDQLSLMCMILLV